MTKRLIPLALIALTSAPLIAAPAIGAPVLAQNTTTGPANPANPVPAAPAIRGLAGPYLAARQAAIGNDYSSAANYYLQAMAQDDTDPFLQDSALVSLISAGNMERAAALSSTMSEQGRATELAKLMQRTELARTERWQDLIGDIDRESGRGATPNDPGAAANMLLDRLMRAWALLGAGNARQALTAFEDLGKIRGARPMVNYHLALAKAVVGDYEGAEALLADPETGSHLMGVTARAQILSQLERNADAVAMLEATPGFAEEPQLVAMRDRLKQGQTLPFDSVRNPADGVAQAYLTFAGVLATAEEPDPIALIHARLAAYLAPHLGEARLLTAQLLQGFGQFDLAEREFEALRDLGDMRPIAQLSRIDALARAERLDDAEKAALALTAAQPDMAQGWIALGDLLRQQDKFAQAVPAYDKALDLIGDQSAEARWFPLYARGIALERSGQFPKAEKDLREALKIRPDSAQILNYLGYSLVDRGEKLDEALDLIQRAVELRPDDGYIVDSLAWAYFRLGRYDEAVAPMERAVAAMAADSLVNDHMGDIYWMVGRHREAEIQWQRALSLKPEKESDAARIRAKLERGLDAILAEEQSAGGAPQPAVPEPAKN
ncbi:tetratricopeptide repeat protein [Paracoccus ravus]|uniref:tetratricopeptide repeat protein n=1 Tax=Paracoccus ravus TaxID=2447760 RepID=UPI001FD69907|nr:tetratricopeptide repeat protein [Paracoccus ravus]